MPPVVSSDGEGVLKMPEPRSIAIETLGADNATKPHSIAARMMIVNSFFIVAPCYNTIVAKTVPS